MVARDLRTHTREAMVRHLSTCLTDCYRGMFNIDGIKYATTWNVASWGDAVPMYAVCENFLYIPPLNGLSSSMANGSAGVPPYTGCAGATGLNSSPLRYGVHHFSEIRIIVIDLVLKDSKSLLSVELEGPRNPEFSTTITKLLM